MNLTHIQKKLETMKGRSFEYAKQIHVIKNFEIDEENEKFTIVTDKKVFDRKFESAAEFFKYWYETDENIQLDKATKSLQSNSDGPLPAVYQQENNLADELVGILKDNIAKVKQNPAYIKQAQAINNNVNSILHVQKLKLDLMKQMKNH